MTDWIAVGGSLVGGGAMGALITTVVASARNRKQPITYRTEIIPAFNREMFSTGGVSARLTLASIKGGHGEDIPNLFVVKVDVVNGGNHDFQSFNVGLTLSQGDLAVHCDVATPDRHHQAKLATTIGPGAPAPVLDFELVPFNRQDLYKFTLYLVVPEGQTVPREIALSSPEPVTFKKSSSAEEMLLTVAKVAIELGPFRLSVR